MTETEAKTAKPQAIVENRGFYDIVKDLVGKAVTIVNPESFEHAPVGYTLKPGFYRAKVVGIGNDYLIFVTELSKPKGGGKEPVKQYLPISQIKRVSMMKGDRLIHI